MKKNRLELFIGYLHFFNIRHHALCLISFIFFADIPAAVSYPHFYRSDPSLLNEVDGLEPNADKHGSEIVLQPVSLTDNSGA